MTAPESTRERLAEALAATDSFGSGTSEVLADALLPLIDTLLREQREGIAAEIEGISWRSDLRPEAVRSLAIRIARTFGGER